jgi:hypothetical protein
MTEVPLDFPRAWVTFTDPEDPSRGFRCDLTWLTSNWTCIFGGGCKGIYKGRPGDACCTFGAWFSDPADEKRVKTHARKLTEDDWQYRTEARTNGWLVTDEDGRRKTRVVDGACIFLNRPDHPSGGGCALHQLALKTGQHIVETKPNVCWLFPIRHTVWEGVGSLPDGTSYNEICLSEFDRGSWGPAGHDFDWYCTGNTDAHIGPEPLFESSKVELQTLMGHKAYEILAKLCRQHLEAPQPSLPHPADAKLRPPRKRRARPKPKPADE